MKDFQKGQVKVRIRHSGEKFQETWENFLAKMADLLTLIHT